MKELRAQHRGGQWYSLVSHYFAPLPSNVTISEAGKQLFSFVFVRHPFARFVSAYEDKIANQEIKSCM